MKIENNKHVLRFLYILIICNVLWSCSKHNDNPSSTVDDKLVHAVVVGENPYLSRIKDLSVGSVNNNNALELGKNTYMFTYKDNFFALEFSNANRITKYVKKGDEGLSKTSVLDFLAAAKIQRIAFLSDNKAYVSYKGMGKIAVIDPQAMSILKEIDISQYAVGQGDNNPDAVDMKIVGNRLYVSLYQEKALFSPQELAAFLLIIDTDTDRVIKMAKDTRGLCLVGNDDPDDSMIVDEKGDLYVYCTSGYGYIPVPGGVRDGFLRIKKGETDFDQSYIFTINDKNIPDFPGGKASYIFHKIYIGNGKFVCFLVSPALTSNPPDFVNDHNFLAYEVDIYNKSFKKINAKPTTGNYTCGLCIYDNQVLMGLATVDGIGYYTYNIASGAVSTQPVIKTQGSPFYIHPF